MEDSDIHAPAGPHTNIPALKVGSEEVTESQDKAKAFVEALFPKTADAEKETIMPCREEVKWEPISELEIHRSLKAAKGTTAPREDGTPTLVWKHLWTYLRDTVTHLFTKIDRAGVPSRPVETSSNCGA